MLRIQVQLLHHGFEDDACEIARAEISNIGGDPLTCDYHYRLMAPASPFAPAVKHEGIVIEYRRHQSVWVLLREAIEDWWVTDGWRGVAPRDGNSKHVRALLGGDGRVLELTCGPWRMARVGPSAWLFLRGGSAQGRWSGLGIGAARTRLLAAVADDDAAMGATPSSVSDGSASDTDSGVED